MGKRTTTKEKLLTILKKNRRLPIGAIMEHFSISEIAVRKQLHELEQQGLIKAESNKQKLGRPYLTYDLTKEGHETFSYQYRSLPVELLQDLEELQGKQAVHDLLNKHTDRDKSNLAKAIQADDFESKVEEMIRVQNAKGYMLEVEKDESGSYEIKNFNCPVATIASCYHQMCINELKVYEEVFPKSEVTAHSFIARGEPVCKWTISKPDER